MGTTAGASAAAGPRVLIAEDEAHLGTLLELFLAGRGCTVTLVRDGREALAALREAAADGPGFDVAIVDVQMPALDGLAVCRAARRLPLAPEVILASGNATLEVVQQALRLGAHDAIAKPYRMAELELLVRRAAAVRALRRTLAAVRVTQRLGGTATFDAAGALHLALDVAALPAEDVHRCLLGGSAAEGASADGGAADGAPPDGAPPDGAAPPDERAPWVALAVGATVALQGLERLPTGLAAGLAHRLGRAG